MWKLTLWYHMMFLWTKFNTLSTSELGELANKNGIVLVWFTIFSWFINYKTKHIFGCHNLLIWRIILITSLGGICLFTVSGFVFINATIGVFCLQKLKCSRNYSVKLCTTFFNYINMNFILFTWLAYKIL